MLYGDGEGVQPGGAHGKTPTHVDGLGHGAGNQQRNPVSETGNEDGSEQGGAECAPQRPEERDGGGGGTYLGGGYGILGGQHHDLHGHAHAGPQHNHIETHREVGGVQPQLGQQPHADHHQDRPGYRKYLVSPCSGDDLFGGDGRDQQSDHHRHQEESRHHGRHPVHQLKIERQIDDGAEHDNGQQEAHAGRHPEDADAKQAGRQDRLGGLPLPQDEGGDQHHRGDGQDDDRRRSPSVLGPAPHGHQEGGGDGQHQQHRPQVIDVVRLPTEWQLEDHRGDEQGDDADGHVDVEDPSPRQVVGEHSAEERSGHRRQCEGGAEVPLVAAAITGRDHVGDDRHGHGHQSAGPDALDPAEGDEFAHVLTETRQHGSDQKNHNGELKDSLAAQLVGQLPVQGGGDGRRQQVGGDHPADVVETCLLYTSPSPRDRQKSR